MCEGDARIGEQGEVTLDRVFFFSESVGAFILKDDLTSDPKAGCSLHQCVLTVLSENMVFVLLSFPNSGWN